MKINEWRNDRGYSYRKLAKIINAGGATTVRRWCLPDGHKDKLIPSPRYMKMIIDLSNGEVMPNDYFR